MKRLPKALFALLLIMLSTVVGRCADDEQQPDEQGKTEAVGVFHHIDIQPQSNQALSTDFHGYPGNNLKTLPRGVQNLGEVEFKIGEKFVQLASKRAPDFPEKVEGIPIGQSAKKVHFLHATGWGSPGLEDGTPLGSYVFHYDDDSTAVMPIEYGHDVRDWWAFGEYLKATRAEVVWAGVNDASKDFRGQRIMIRIFKSTWENPFPDKKIVSMDYTSRNETISAPFLIALSTESSAGKVVMVADDPIAEQLKEAGALLQFGDDGKATRVTLAGPGLKQTGVRGLDTTIELVAEMPTVEVLDVGYSAVTDEGLKSLKKLPHLRWLTLNITAVTDAGLSHLKELESLERLRLHRTQITNDGLQNLAGLKNLEILDLSQTPISDEGLAHLANLKSLKKLDLRGTQVTDEGVAKLRESLAEEVRIDR